MSLLGREVNTPFIAAILTIVGYSINNTIVVFDRIRENQQLQRRRDIAELVNAEYQPDPGPVDQHQLDHVVCRGRLVLLRRQYDYKDFTLTLLVGIIMGTYTSIFVVGPLWLTLRERTRVEVGKAA